MIKPAKAWMQALQYTKEAEGDTLLSRLPALVAAYGEKPALIGADGSLTYRALADRVDGYARWAVMHNLAGQAGGLLLENCPDYVAVWLGLTRVGCTVALLNTNLPPEALAHSLTAAAAQFVIVSDALVARTVDAERPVWLLTQVQASFATSAQLSLDAMPLPSPDQTALYIYTSGTTGLPKATRITQRRITEWSYWFAGIMDTRETDRLYNCLPLYHSIGGITAIGSMLVQGGAVVIRERFSASQFWTDVSSHGCTIFQYIGELCRYLTLRPSCPAETRHQLRLAVGNGLQKDVWEVFKARFNIPQILEYYAATEGNLSLYNCEGKPGAIGRIPPMLATQFAVALIRCHPETGDPLRDAQGLCQVCDPDEAGEAVSRLGGARRFDGYTDDAASEKKILRGVLAPDDAWFRTGDLMRRDAAGYFYFVDRLGDTFRWKGENVSTTEVAQVLRRCPGVLEAVVYGVTIAGEEGKAGMAAITTDASFHFGRLTAIVEQHLPPYARPLYVRLCPRLDATGTFKLVKHHLATEGFQRTTDPVWRLSGGRYEPWENAV